MKSTYGNKKIIPFSKQVIISSRTLMVFHHKLLIPNNFHNALNHLAIMVFFVVLMVRVSFCQSDPISLIG